MNAYSLIVFVHVLAAIVWLGGMFFLALVGAPVLRRIEPPALKATIFRDLGQQFRWVGWTCIVLLIGTGIGNLHFRGLLTEYVWTGLDFWSTSYGGFLAAKIGLVIAIVFLQALHDFWLGPLASRLPPESPRRKRARRVAALLARGSAVLGFVLIYVATRLARGG